MRPSKLTNTGDDSELDRAVFKHWIRTIGMKAEEEDSSPLERETPIVHRDCDNIIGVIKGHVRDKGKIFYRVHWFQDGWALYVAHDILRPITKLEFLSKIHKD